MKANYNNREIWLTPALNKSIKKQKQTISQIEITPNINKTRRIINNTNVCLVVVKKKKRDHHEGSLTKIK